MCITLTCSAWKLCLCANVYITSVHFVCVELLNRCDCLSIHKYCYALNMIRLFSDCWIIFSENSSQNRAGYRLFQTIYIFVCQVLNHGLNKLQLIYTLKVEYVCQFCATPIHLIVPIHRFCLNWFSLTWWQLWSRHFSLVALVYSQLFLRLWLERTLFKECDSSQSFYLYIIFWTNQK